ncbi:MAG: hypothetical protein WB919_18310 [Candidatus Sulfotelmatobacter sp.]
MQTTIWERCNTIEQCYEFMLAYAAKGLPSDEGSNSDAQIREFLERAVNAMTGLVESCSLVVEEEGLEPTEKYHAFFTVIDRDTRDALAAIELVLAQSSISSQLVDNLNASIHLRALLTDLFLVGDVLRSRVAPRPIP